MVAWQASSVLGCSATPGGDPVGDNNRAAWTLGMIAILPVLLLVALYFLRSRKGLVFAIASLVIIAIHPARTLSAGGDCGAAKVNYAKWFTGFLILLATVQFVLWLKGLWSARTKLA